MICVHDCTRFLNNVDDNHFEKIKDVLATLPVRFSTLFNVITANMERIFVIPLT